MRLSVLAGWSLAACLCLGTATIADAGPILLGEFSSNESVIDFGTGSLEVLPEPYTVSGVTFDELGFEELYVANRASNFDNISGASLGRALNTRAVFRRSPSTLVRTKSPVPGCSCPHLSNWRHFD